ncbi:MAG: ABC transporter substrate-binding protein [Candidatus Zixiibacteriota bacterium]
MPCLLHSYMMNGHRNRTRIVLKAILQSVVALCFAMSVAASGLHRVAVVTSDTHASSKRTVNGAKKTIKREYPDSEFRQFQINRNDASNRKIVDSIRLFNPSLILTVGSSATEFAREHFDDVPTVFAAVMYPELSGFVESLNRPGGKMTGASLNVPVTVQFNYFKQVVPHLRRMGVLYTKNTASLIPPARIVAHEMGIELVSVLVNKARDLPKSLDSLAATVDGIWSVADPVLFTPQSTRYILLNTVRKGIPFMGFSRHVVESGALFALDFDYKAIGFQAGEIACAILDGAKPANIRVTSADVIWFHYNENTARRLKLDIPEELIAIAREVYR